jgi:hypothetical protein
VTQPGSSYYWAGGRKIPLLPTDDVALDLDSDVARSARSPGLGAKGRQLSRSLLLVPREVAEQALGEATATAPGVHPVFRTEDGGLVAVLPQVRVEAADPRILDEASRSVSQARVVERTDERLVLEPTSGRGEDALALANRLAETIAADVSQARFVRVVRRPGK